MKRLYSSNTSAFKIKPGRRLIFGLGLGKVERPITVFPSSILFQDFNAFKALQNIAFRADLGRALEAAVHGHNVSPSLILQKKRSRKLTLGLIDVKT